MMKRTKLQLGLLAALLVPATAPAFAQAPTPPIAIDNILYALPPGAAKNLDAVKALIAAGNALGMVRNGPRTFGATTHGWQYKAKGTMAGQNVSASVGFDYRLPAIRIEIERADKTKEITVASGDLAWDESKPSIYSQPAKNSAAERLISLWILPPAVIFEGAAAAETIRLANKGGLRELTIPVPRYKSELTATLNAAGQVTHTEMKVDGKLYSGDYSDYQNDKLDFHVNFPHKIVQKVDGNTIADLTVFEHVSGGYQVWPVPAQLRPAAK